MQIKQKYKNSMNKGLSHNKGPFAADQGGPLLWEATVYSKQPYKQPWGSNSQKVKQLLSNCWGSNSRQVKQPRLDKKV